MYTIIGGDQKPYGPVSAEELRRWIAEGRLNGRTAVLAEGSNEWKELATFAEFAESLRIQAAPAASAGAALPPVSAADWSAQILAQQPQLQVGRCLARSWKLLTSGFGALFGAVLLVWLISLVCQFIPLVGGMVYLVLRGVFFGGLYLLFLNRIRGRTVSVGDVFAGFNLAFAQLLLTGLVCWLLSGIASLFCVVPGLYLYVAWTFAVPLVADKRLEFWSAMELSRKIVTRVWFQTFGLLVLAFLPLLLANIFVGIKMAALAISTMQDLMGSSGPDFGHMFETMKTIAKASLPLAMLLKIVLLLNLPFAVGALMYAYEDLFGARTTPTA